MTPDVSVIIPTFRRPDRIKRALNSVLAQKVQALVEIIVLDNDPDASARDMVRSLAAGTRWPIIYGHEPSPGVANARNAALKLARSKLIVFLDDDETAASDNWLEALLDVQAQTGADLVFGPVQGRVEDDVPHKTYIEERFTRIGPEQSGVIETYYGCGNSLLKRAKFFSNAPIFDPAMNEIGGEDDALFSKALADGAKVAWAANALVYEEILPERATLTYSLTKAFAFGQGPTQTCWQHRKIFGVAYWMVVGLGQFCVFGGLYALRWVVRAKPKPELLDRAAQGLGKLLWFKGLEPRFYGASAL